MAPVAPTVSADALRDALGLARLLHELERRTAASPERLMRIVEAGRLLAIALRFARCDADSMGARAAPERAREGFKVLAAVDWPEVIRQLVDVAAKRVA